MKTAARNEGLAATVADIGKKARVVGERRAAYDASFADDRAAHAALLDGVIEAVRPALRALCSRISVAATISPAGTTTDPAPFRGLFLTPEGPFRKRSEGDKDRGRFYGKSLVLTQDGKLVDLLYDGPWTRAAGEVSRWTARIEPTSAEQVAEDHSVADILGMIDDALVSQADGSMPDRTRQNNERAALVRGIAKLVRGAS